MKKQKSAFSLAEILITLGIVGIVAAMVLPMFIANYENKRIIPQIKKAYSTLEQGVTTSQLINASTDHWDYNLNSKQFYEKYLKDYFIIAETKTIKDLKNQGIKYYNMDSSLSTESYVNDDNTVIATLADGYYMFISEYAGGKYKAIGLDINGKKKPNIIGKDYFVFTIQQDYGVTPYGYGNGGYKTFGTDYNNIDKILNDSPYGCKKVGAYCSAYLIYKGWEMGNDYPR